MAGSSADCEWMCSGATKRRGPSGALFIQSTGKKDDTGANSNQSEAGFYPPKVALMAGQQSLWDSRVPMEHQLSISNHR